MKPILTFPTTFPVKVMGVNEDDFESLVIKIIQKHASMVAEREITRRPSRGGKYISVTIYIQAENQEQLDAIYRELSAHERVLMML